MKIDVTASELRSAASNISKANEAFRSAANSLQAAGEELSEQWEGDTKDKFVTAMAERKTWYAEMSTILDSYVKTMQEFADKYEEMDERSAAAIRKH